MRQFHTAARRGGKAVPNEVDIEFEWEVRDDEFVTMTAKPPTTGQVALFLADQRGGLSNVRAVFDFLAAVLSQADYDIIEEQLHEGLDVAVMIELVEYLIEEWGGRPTSAPSASSQSAKRTGRQSTAKQPSVVSTSSL